MKADLKICCIPAGTGGVAFYRIKQPYNFLKEKGADVFIFDQTKHDGKRLYEEQQRADVIVFQCPWSEGIRDSVALLKKAHGDKKKVVLEFDDNLFNVDPWNEKYYMFGLKEYSVTVDKSDPQTIKNLVDHAKTSDWIRYEMLENGDCKLDMWRDGYKGFDVEANMRKYQATIEACNLADMITVTTMDLGKVFKEIAPNTKVCVYPNTIDPDRWLDMEDNETDEIRIGWQGGSSHFDDIRGVINELEEIKNKYPNVKFVFMGIQYNTLFKELGDAVEYIPWHGDINTYPLVVREMKLDIGLCPLKATGFSEGKSPIKWIEYSQMGIPTVASETVYGKFITHRKTGLIAKEKGDWVKYLSELIEDEQKRKDIAKRAKDRVKKKFSIDQNWMVFKMLSDLYYTKLYV